jgi:ATP-binding cassette, subfamily C, bacterial CydC
VETLINLLLRFADYEAGRIDVGGVNLRNLAHEDVRRLFGVMTQRAHLFNTTIRENIRIGRKVASDAEIEDAARAAQIHDFILTLPNGYDTYVGEGGALLSGGERQRIALARVILKDAPIWLLDEITTNLDPITATDVLKTVFNVAQDRTLLLVTHQPDAVAGHHFDTRIQIQRRISE